MQLRHGVMFGYSSIRNADLKFLTWGVETSPKGSQDKSNGSENNQKERKGKYKEYILCVFLEFAFVFLVKL